MKNAFCLALLAIICFAGCKSAEELYNEGLVFYKGEGVAQDIDKATTLFQKAANKGYSEAKYKLATVAIEKGNLEDGVVWFDKVIDEDPSAAAKIGDMFYHGTQEVPQNYVYANRFLTKAIELDKADDEVYLHMADIYYSGHGVNVDYGKAFNYYKRAADMNNPTAIYDLAVCYYNGNGVEMNRSLAKEYIRKAADLGSPAAQEYLESERREEERARQQAEFARQQQYEQQQQAINNQVISCPGCQGRGRRRGTGFNSGGTEICPYCGGAGVVTYGFARKYGLIN